jgi:hypothetical protein
MTDVFERVIIPRRWRMPLNPFTYAQYVFVNWLDVEIDPTAPRRMPTLHFLSHWRNREVHGWVQANKSIWQARLVAELYGPLAARK